MTHSAAAVLVAIPEDFLIADSIAGTTASWYFRLLDFGTRSTHFRSAVAKGEFWEAETSRKVRDTLGKNTHTGQINSASYQRTFDS